MTALTPVYHIKYLVQGDPAYLTRQVLQENAETVEAALMAGGITPPGASDYLSLLARVIALEPDPWQAIAYVTGTAAIAGYRTPRYRLEGDLVRLEGVWGITGTLASNTVLGIVPALYRPSQIMPLGALVGAAGGGQVDVTPAGQIVTRTAMTGFISLIDETWTTS